MYQQSSENILVNTHLTPADRNCPSNGVFFWSWDFLHGCEWADICVDESAPITVP